MALSLLYPEITRGKRGKLEPKKCEVKKNWIEKYRSDKTEVGFGFIYCEWF